MTGIEECIPDRRSHRFVREDRQVILDADERAFAAGREIEGRYVLEAEDEVIQNRISDKEEHVQQRGAYETGNR